MNYDTFLKNLRKRLAESEGRRIARRNAHRDLDSFLRRVRRELRSEFPPLAKNGAPVKGALELPRGMRSCPACGDHAPTFRKLARHVLSKHNGKCPCGFVPKAIKVLPPTITSLPTGESNYSIRSRPFRSKAEAQLAGHLKNVKELVAHFTLGAMGAFAPDLQKFNWGLGMPRILVDAKTLTMADRIAKMKVNHNL